MTIGRPINESSLRQRVLRLLRENPLLSQDAVAERVGISRRQVQRYIASLRKVTLDDYKPTFVPLTDVPPREQRERAQIWKSRIDALVEGKAVMLEYNNRQRVHQVATSVRQAAKYWKVSIRTRVIHGEPAIHGTDKWLLYFWKKVEAPQAVD